MKSAETPYDKLLTNITKLTHETVHATVFANNIENMKIVSTWIKRAADQIEVYDACGSIFNDEFSFSFSHAGSNLLGTISSDDMTEADIQAIRAIAKRIADKKQEKLSAAQRKLFDVNLLLKQGVE